MHWVAGEISREEFTKLLRVILIAGTSVIALSAAIAMALGKLQWSGRSLTLLDPTYASKYIPIIASVGEHQPTTWAAFYFSLGPTMLFVPLGMYYSFQQLNSGYIFMIVYSVFAFYFAGVMVRLLLTLAPAACFLSAVGISSFMDQIARLVRSSISDEPKTPIETPAKESKTSLKHRKHAKVATNKNDSTEAARGQKMKPDDVLTVLAEKLRFEEDQQQGSGKSNGQATKVSRAIGLLLVACCVRTQAIHNLLARQ